MEPSCGLVDDAELKEVLQILETIISTETGSQDPSPSPTTMISGGGLESITPVPMSTSFVNPYVEILEQPASKALRFRYECEGRSAGSIPGVNSTAENKTFPSIRIVGYRGRATVIVSCVTEEQPYRPHPHNLVGKEGCRNGVCKVEVASENMTVTFANLGIQCVKKKDIDMALQIRKRLQIDPFQTGFDHVKTKIDLNAVRLCFQVFIPKTAGEKCKIALHPVVSDPIYDKKAMSDLVICKLSHCSASVAGGLEMILLCEKVPKEEIKVKFFEERYGAIVWEAYADFQPSQVHKQVAIAFRTPSYKTQQIEQPVPVFVQLQRHDGVTSEALPFEMLPLGSDGGLFDRPVKHEPMDHTFPPYGSCTIAGPSVSYPVGNPDSFPPLDTHGERSGLLPRKSPGLIDCMDYRDPSIPSQKRNIQIPYLGSHNLQQISQPAPAIPQQIKFGQGQPEAFNVLDRVDDQPGSVLEPLPNADNNLLDLDTQQYSFEPTLNHLNSADLAVFGGADLSENLSSGLSISDPVEGPGDNNSESTSSMSDSVTQLTTSTLQRINVLNSMYKPPSDS